MLVSIIATLQEQCSSKLGNTLNPWVASLNAPLAPKGPVRVFILSKLFDPISKHKPR